MGSATATSNWIRCPQCDGDVLIAAEYVTKSTVRAPALKCARCKMLHLDEAVARSPDERESVRMAKAERAALSASDSNLAAEPQTFEGPDLHSNTFEAVADRVGQPGGRVLLVDDEDIVRAGHGQVLTRAGWTVVAEGDARLAAKRLAVESFDVIVTDLVMPSMSGLDLLRTAREYDLDVPVVILTGRPDVQSAMEAMQYGAFRYIDKPVLPAMLVDVVGRARDLHMMARFKREALSVLDLPNRALGDPALFRRIARLESVRVGDSMRQIAKSPLAWPAEATHRPRCRAAAGARGNRMPTAGTRAPRDR